MVEYSEGYKEAARKRLEELEKSMSPCALTVSKLLSEMLKNGSDKTQG